MLKYAAVLCVVAGLTMPALAQPDEARIDVKGRLKGATDWVDLVDVSLLPGQAADFEIAIYYRWRRFGDTYGFSTCVNSPIVSPWRTDLGDTLTLLDRADSAQHPDGRQGRFNFGAQRQVGYSGGVNDAGRLRIAAPNNTQGNPAGGVSVKQNTPSASGSLFDQSNPALGFRFEITLAADSNPSTRTVVADVPRSMINSYSAYLPPATQATSNQLSALQPTDPFTVTITTIPAPAGLAAMLAMVCTFARRRERSPDLGRRI